MRGRIGITEWILRFACFWKTQKPRYYTIEEMLDMIDEPNRFACVKILADNRKLFQTAQGSTNNHQRWPGGYFDHVQEVMNIAVVLYSELNSLRPLPFSLSDLLIVLYFHDIEKPWKYELREDGELYHKSGFETKEDCQRFRIGRLKEYGIALTQKQENGLKYVEGEYNDYTNRRRVMGPLACVAHLCDVTSARLWFDCPMAKGDPWTGARCIRD